MGDYNATSGSEPNLKGHEERAKPNASTVQDVPVNKVEASGMQYGHDGAETSEESRPILHPDDAGRSQATPSTTQGEPVADDVSVGAPSAFSTGLNVCPTP
jgi:hypothetical protein